MSLDTCLRKSMEEKRVVRLTTDQPELEIIEGVVTVMHPEFIVLRDLPDLAFDGVSVLPQRVISGHRDGEFEDCLNRIIRHTGEIRNARTPVWLESCETLADVLRELEQRGIWPSVLTRLDDEEEGQSWNHYVGPVLTIADDCFDLHHFDGTGSWDDVYQIEMEEVGQIEFEDAYSRTFSAYMRAAGPERPL